MLATATEVFLVIAMILGFGGVLGLGNAILAFATGCEARWYWHIAIWLACFVLLVTDAYLGAEAGMWCLSSDAVAPNLRCR
ncbi:hypothetical protein [Nonomuraea sp. NPDC003804]|uniref:hypothetical protein n=1 Tax=Nonomuraea sp. NPDC003804 TaxID=3154547 RepID=UPI0033A746C0